PRRRRVPPRARGARDHRRLLRALRREARRDRVPLPAGDPLPSRASAVATGGLGREDARPVDAPNTWRYSDPWIGGSFIAKSTETRPRALSADISRSRSLAESAVWASSFLTAPTHLMLGAWNATASLWAEVASGTPSASRSPE